jgi:hypothetical protein
MGGAGTMTISSVIITGRNDRSGARNIANMTRHCSETGNRDMESLC